MNINLIIATSIIVIVVVLCTIWTTWWLRRNSIKIVMEMDDESKHNDENLEILNTHIIKTNNLLETYNKVIDEKGAELNKYKDGGELAKQKGLFNSLIEIEEFIKKFSENLKYNEIPEWDSIGHMTLMSGLEEGFNITMETDDIVDFSSFKKGIEILEKYGVKF